jgi:hypothetical protein
MGDKLAAQCFREMDFPYPYSHENPFPINGKIDPQAINAAFTSVFHKAVQFLS